MIEFSMLAKRKKLNYTRHCPIIEYGNRVLNEVRLRVEPYVPNR